MTEEEYEELLGLTPQALPGKGFRQHLQRKKKTF